jgi:hypothetical protein
MADTDEQEFEELFGNDTAEDASAASVDDDDADSFFEEIDQAEVGDTTSAHKATVQVAGKTYAVGLFWKSSDDPKRVSKEAIAYSKSDSIGADLYCVRIGEAVQFGLGQKERGHKAGMPSLAASIDESLTGDWLAAFYIGGFYYVAAVRKGLVLSERDQIFVVEEDAKEVFTDLYYGADWDDVICPDVWGMASEEVREEHIEDVVQGTSAGKLKPTNPMAGIIKFGVLLALLAGIGFGGHTLYQTHLEKERIAALEAAREAAKERAETIGKKSLGQRAQEEIDRALAAVEDTVAPILGIERSEPQQLPDTPPPAPWKGRKNGTGMLIACVQDILKAPMDVPGWQTTQISCNERNIQVTLERQGGTALWAETHLKKSGYPDVNYRRNAGAGSLYVSYPPSYVSQYGENLAAQPVDVVVDYLREHFAEMDMRIEAVVQPDNPNNHRSRFFREGTISFNTDISPVEFSSIFSKVKGLVIDSVSLNLGSNQWLVRGSIYDRREIPLPRPGPPQE